jgi:plasmid stability protein
MRAAEHGRSTEAEIRDILEKAAIPEGGFKLGSLLAAIGRQATVPRCWVPFINPWAAVTQSRIASNGRQLSGHFGHSLAMVVDTEAEARRGMKFMRKDEWGSKQLPQELLKPGCTPWTWQS